MLRRSLLSGARPSSAAWRLLHEQLLLSGSHSSSTADLASTSGRGAWKGGSISSSSSASERLFRRSSSSTSFSSSSANVDPHEVSKFDYDWWDLSGPAAPLHALNSARVRFIRSCLEPLAAAKAAKEKAQKTKKTGHRHHRLPLPLSGLRVLDVGCGGGILSEPLARLGAQVTGIDAGAAGPEAAARHAAADPAVAARLSYFPSTSLEQLLPSEGGEGERKETHQHRHAYDCVVASEVIEHVPDPSAFVRELERALKKEDEGGGGEGEPAAPSPVVVVSTLARTPRSWLAAVAAAEHALGLLPVGTHDWNKFVNPEELAAMAEAAGLEMDAASGMEPEVMRFEPGEAAAAVAAAAPALAVAAAEAARRRIFGKTGGGEDRKKAGPPAAVGALFGRMSWTLTGDLGVNYIASFRRKQQRG